MQIFFKIILFYNPEDLILRFSLNFDGYYQVKYKLHSISLLSNQNVISRLTKSVCILFWNFFFSSTCIHQPERFSGLSCFYES